MRTTIFVLFALLVATTLSTGMWLDYRSCEYQRKGDYDQINLSCEGGSNSYLWEYSNLPSGWVPQNNIIYVPAGQVRFGQYYPFKVNIRDRVYGNRLKISLFINLAQSGISDIFDSSYDADISNSLIVNNIITQRRNVISSSSTSRSSSSTTNIRQSSTFSFPQFSDIETRIVAGDVNYLRNVITNIIQSGQECKTIADFLSRILSRIQSQITISSSQNSQIERNLALVQEEILFIQNQISQLQSSSIDVTSLNIQIRQFRSQLSSANTQKIQLQVSIQQSNIQVRSFEVQINQIRNNDIKVAQEGILQATRRVNQIDNRLETLQRQIANLRTERQQKIQLSQRYRNELQDAQIRIQRLNIRIRQTQTKIRNIQNQIANINRNISILQSKIQDIETQISIGVTQTQTQINQLTSTITVKRRRVIQLRQQLQNNQNVYNSLNSAIRNFEEQINRQYYSCYQYQGSINQNGQNIISSQNYLDNVQLSYGATSNQFINYLYSVYGTTPNTNSFNVGFSGTIYPISIYSPSWVNVYGMQNLYQSSGSDFSCNTSPSNIQTYRGRIIGIDRNIVRVQDYNGQAMQLHLGACTKIETLSTLGVLEIGDNIYFKGNNAGSHYNAYHITCV